MRILVFVLVACSHSQQPPAPDGPPEPPKSCRHFGAFARAGTIGPVSHSAIESDPHVMRDGGVLKMWFTTANPTPPADVRIAYAESDDGLTWRNERDAVISPTANTIDGEGVETISVVHTGSTYRAYYTADLPPDGSIRYSIGGATSSDGITWTKTAQPVLPALLPWEQTFCADAGCTHMIGGLLEPSVLFDGTTYRMWFAALGVQNGLPSYRIGYATSTDGQTWTHHPQPVFTAGPAGAWDEALVSHTDVIADPSGGFHLFYFGSSLADSQRCDDAGGCLITPGGIGHAFSEDGITWTRDPQPVIPTAPGFDAWSVGGPSAMIEDGVMRLWYFGIPAAQSIDLRMGYASAPCM